MTDVRINSPKSFGVIVDGKPVLVPAGISIVDEAVANHWYAKAHGVELLDSATAQAPGGISPDDVKVALKTAADAAKAATKAVAAAKAKPDDAALQDAAAKAQADQANADAVVNDLKLAGLVKEDGSAA